MGWESPLHACQDALLCMAQLTAPTARGLESGTATLPHLTSGPALDAAQDCRERGVGVWHSTRLIPAPHRPRHQADPSTDPSTIPTPKSHQPHQQADPSTQHTPQQTKQEWGADSAQRTGRQRDGHHARSLWLSPSRPHTMLCHTAGLQQDGDRVLHASVCGQGNGAEGGGAGVAGLARGAESRSPRALLRAAEEQRGTHPIQRQRSPSCPRQASCCPITAPSLDPR